MVRSMKDLLISSRDSSLRDKEDKIDVEFGSLLCFGECWSLKRNYVFANWDSILEVLSGDPYWEGNLKYSDTVCNNQLLDWMETELIWMLSFIPGLASTLPKIIGKLHAIKAKYMASTPLPVTSNIKV